MLVHIRPYPQCPWAMAHNARHKATIQQEAEVKFSIASKGSLEVK